MTTTDDPLVSTEWLAAHLERSQGQGHRRVVQDAGRAAAADRTIISPRIFRARCSSMSTRCRDHSNPLPHMFPDAEQFGRDVGALGIGNDDTVVVYDSGGWVAAPRAWWMFLSFGHRNVRVLDGGLKKWVAEGRKVESGEVTPKPATFKATFDARRTRSHAAAGRQSRKPGRAGDRCARQRTLSGQGAPSRGRAFAPATFRAACNLPYNNLFDAATGTMKSLDELRAAFLGRGRRSSTHRS